MYHNHLIMDTSKLCNNFQRKIDLSFNPAYILSDNIIDMFVEEYKDSYPETTLRDNLKQLVFVQLFSNVRNYVVMTATDFERTKLGNWKDNGGYGYDSTYRNIEGEDVNLHRKIMDAPKGMEVHHIGDQFNNLRKCLTLVTETQHIQIHEDRLTIGPLYVETEKMLKSLLGRLLIHQGVILNE